MRLEQREEREINPYPVQRMSVQEITSEVSTVTSAQESAEANVDAVTDDLRERIDTASSADQQSNCADIESQKALRWVPRCSPN